ncbi:cytochrome c-type biogenesis protein CcmH [Rhodobacteraceae bacterium HSP-20]|uniref:Cytochrome c-type biogenesis protein n=1 Tax=Paragemmobacter amnigenus TaxID=2852097 RepID=A0ABS6IXW0_9RHOB|nr:cytochrome c-type biogenesis protein [Rhodobacter amnigenus]MBU9696349.1 cytochrome c-type biogenesis protein CcmH [Rhodobacter amnigenus]MBV4387576.1 cytochrome c-type biogenesis protein CcmH [Rhodobacter amnigenus]
MKPALLALALVMAVPVHAVQPEEMLADPALEARARALSKGLRCLVCRNENIDDSDAQLAKDLRVLLRERLVAGDSDEEAVAFLVDRYGEYVLLNPPATGANILLWIAGPAMLLAGAGIAFATFRRRGSAAAEGLSEEEKARLAEILKE